MLTFDSNILIYAIDTLYPGRQTAALDLLAAAGRRSAFITQQAIGEFCKVARGKRMPAYRLREQVEEWTRLFAIVPTSLDQLLAAAALADLRQKQYWDMVIVRVAADAGATVLFTEDIGDGEVIAGVRIVNPFSDTNSAAVAALLA